MEGGHWDTGEQRSRTLGGVIKKEAMPTIRTLQRKGGGVHDGKTGGIDISCQ